MKRKEAKMFTNILLLSLLSITCGITNGEDNQSLRGQQSAFGLLSEMPIQQREGKMSKEMEFYDFQIF